MVSALAVVLKTWLKGYRLRSDDACADVGFDRPAGFKVAAREIDGVGSE